MIHVKEKEEELLSIERKEQSIQRTSRGNRNVCDSAGMAARYLLACSWLGL